MSGIENKLQRLLPVGQGECGAERVHQQAADLHPEGVPTRPQDPPPLLVRCSSSTRAALQGGFVGKQGQGVTERFEISSLFWLKLNFYS